jgi:hypothetical protein
MQGGFSFSPCCHVLPKTSPIYLIDHGGSQAALGLGQRTLIFSSKKKRP